MPRTPAPPAAPDRDVERIALASEIYRMEEEGLSLSTIAEKLRIPIRQLGQFVKGAFYANACDKLRRARENDEDAELERRRRDERKVFEGFGKDALDYFKLCFKRDGDGNFLDGGAAAWAAEKVTKGRGWDQPPASVRATIEVRVEVVAAKMDAIRASDALRESAVEVEYEELPATQELAVIPMPPRL